MYFLKVADSSLLSDFFAGIEPTGVYTFQHAYSNKKNHALHRTVGDIGGFLGGALLSVASGALGTYAAAKLIKNPTLRRALSEAAKDQILILRPAVMIKRLKLLPEAAKIVMKNKEFVDAAGMAYRGLKSSGDLSKFLSPLRRNSRILSEIEVFRKKYKTDPYDVFRQGIAIGGSLGVAAIGGGMNTLSAHTQYNAGRALAERDKKMKSQNARK